MEQIEKAITDVDHRLGGILTGWQICPHDDADGCACRKPKPGMIKELAELYGVDLKISTMVGDQPVDEHASIAISRATPKRDKRDWNIALSVGEKYLGNSSAP